MRTILIHGASTAAGWYDMERAGWANRLHLDALKSNLESPQEAISIQNMAIPGNTLMGVMKELGHVERYRRLGSVTSILAIGLNESKIMTGRKDPLVSLDKFDLSLQAYMQYMQAQSVNTVVVGTEILRDATIVTENGNTFEDDLVAEYDYILEQKASEFGLPFVSLRNAFKEVGEVEQSISLDGYHPNALGHQAIYSAVKGALYPYEQFNGQSRVQITDITGQLA